MRKEVKKLLNKAFEAKKTGFVRSGSGDFHVPYDPATVLADCVYCFGFVPEHNLDGELVGYCEDVYEEVEDEYLFCGYRPVVRFNKEERNTLKLAGLN